MMGMVGLGPKREPTLMDEFNEATTLSYKNVRLQTRSQRRAIVWLECMARAPV
jgi:hypothetical protein